jgi:hypothetical protein
MESVMVFHDEGRAWSRAVPSPAKENKGLAVLYGSEFDFAERRAYGGARQSSSFERDEPLWDATVAAHLKGLKSRTKPELLSYLQTVVSPEVSGKASRWTKARILEVLYAQVKLYFDSSGAQRVEDVMYLKPPREMPTCAKAYSLITLAD